VVVGLLVLVAGARLTAGQTLGDLAKKEEERRKTVGPASKVISNKDLPPVPPSAAVPPPAPDAAPDAGKPAEAGKPAGAADAEGDKGKKEAGATNKAEPVKDQAYWSGRLKALQAQLDRDQTYSQALQSRINALTTDFVNRDDPAQRTIISRDREKAVAELTRLKEAIQADKKALADFDEEARRASVPPGWLR
jgi:hypothetical protein